VSLLDRLPKVRGRLRADVALAPFTWLRVGGAAEALFMPEDEADLAHFLSSTPDDIPVQVLGVASNTIIRDGGVRGVVIRLGPAFGKISVEGLCVTAGAAALDKSVAKKAAAAGIAGLEFYAGVPGTIGGALRMNAGCYGSETKDKNPEGHSSWKLIDAAGCRGMRVGGAQMSEQHCNFMINADDATAADLEELGETVRTKVLETQGIQLNWEIRRIGERVC